MLKNAFSIFFRNYVDRSTNNIRFLFLSEICERREERESMRGRGRRKGREGIFIYNLHAISNLSESQSGNQGTLILEARNSRCRTFEIDFRFVRLSRVCGYIPPFSRKAASSYISRQRAVTNNS